MDSRCSNLRGQPKGTMQAVVGTGYGSGRSPVVLLLAKDALFQNVRDPKDFEVRNIRRDLMSTLEISTVFAIAFPSGILIVKSPWDEHTGRVLYRYQFNELISKVNVATSNKGKVVGEEDEEDE